MVTSTIRLCTAATLEVANRKMPGASRLMVSTAARQARRAWSRFAADATANVAAVHKRIVDVTIRPDSWLALLRTWRIPADRLTDRDRVER